MTIDVLQLWDFGNPEESEARFRSALADASPDDELILHTQIARTYGLRGDFERARELLEAIRVRCAAAGGAPEVHYHLELGRTYASATHPPESQTAERRERARAEFTRAFELARERRRDYLAIDALHMMTFVDTQPGLQAEWNRKALAFMEASSDPEARKWEAPLRNNLGYALHGLGQFDEALQEFQTALEVRRRGGDPASIRIAHWMIAWTLRAMGRLDEALEIQLRLEAECDEAGEPDPYVFEELELLYKELNNTERAELYAARRTAAS